MNKYHKSGTIKDILEPMTLLGAAGNALGAQTVSGWAENTRNVMVAVHKLGKKCGGIAGDKDRAVLDMSLVV